MKGGPHGRFMVAARLRNRSTGRGRQAGYWLVS